MAFLSHSLYHMPGLAPQISGLFWGPDDFRVSYSNRDISIVERLKMSFRKLYMVDARMLLNNMKSSCRECSKTFWSSTSYSDFPTDQTFHQFYDLDTELDIDQICEWFPGTISNKCDMLAGNAYPSRQLRKINSSPKNHPFIDGIGTRQLRKINFPPKNHPFIDGIGTCNWYH